VDEQLELGISLVFLCITTALLVTDTIRAEAKRRQRRMEEAHRALDARIGRVERRLAYLESRKARY
jgi:hypothetical protein